MKSHENDDWSLSNMKYQTSQLSLDKSVGEEGKEENQ